MQRLQLGIISLFPEMFKALTDYGINSRAIKSGLLTVDTFNPRDFTTDKHATVDDRPYGGGPGMVMKVEPLRDAILAAKNQLGAGTKVIYLSPQGGVWQQQVVADFKQGSAEKLILIAGRYEGIDERIITELIDEEWSIGDYVLSGGELAAMVLADTLIRQLPGALGHNDSADQDSFAEGLLDCPHYTRPEIFNGHEVPAVLLSGDHEKIRRWRLKQSLGRTWLRRPGLLQGRTMSQEEITLLEEFQAEQ